MTLPKILWGIFWFVFRKHLLKVVAMVTRFSQYTFQFFMIYILCVKNTMHAIFSYLLWPKQRVPWILQLFSVKFIFLDKAMNSGKNMKIRDFHYFLFEPTKIQNMDVK